MHFLTRLLISICLGLVLITTQSAQTPDDERKARLEQLHVQRLGLLSSLNLLDGQTKLLEDPLRRAFAKADIADAIWYLDSTRAKAILWEAQRLTMPGEEERERSKSRSVEAKPEEPKSEDLARIKVRSRILQVARRDAAFAKELIAFAKSELGDIEKASALNTLALKALAEKDPNQASEYLEEAIELDPTQQYGYTILQLAAQNRSLADEVISHYLDALRNSALSPDAFFRAYSSLKMAVFPNPLFDFGRSRNIAGPSQNVLRSFAQMVLQQMKKFATDRPGSMSSYRYVLSDLSAAINQSAPELRTDWLWLEQLTRRSGSGPLDLSNPNSVSPRNGFEDKVKEALDTKETKALIEALKHAVYLNEFSSARSILSEIKDEKVQSVWAEYTNSSEAMWLVKKGDVLEAERIARKLKDLRNIGFVYSAIIETYVDKKDDASAVLLTGEVMKILQERKDETVPVGFFNNLIRATSKLNDTSAFQAADRLVIAFNAVTLPEGLNPGFDPYLFRGLANKHDDRAVEIGESFRHPYPRVLVLAAIYGSKAKKLFTDIEAASATKPSAKG